MVRCTILYCSAVAALQHGVFSLVGKFARTKMNVRDSAKMSPRDNSNNVCAKIRLRDDSFVKNHLQKWWIVIKDVLGK